MSTLLVILLFLAASSPFWGGRRLPILMYHKVRPAPADDLTVPLDVFRSQLDVLAARGYQSITFARLLALHQEDAEIPDRPILLTFDDAYADFEEHAAAAMRERGLGGTVFLPVGCIGGENTWDGGGEPLMNWDDIRRLAADGTEFGLHSFQHDNYHDLSLEDMRVDLARCMAELDARDVPYSRVLAYPYGGFPRTEPMRTRMKDLFREIGLEYAVRIGSRIERLAPKDPFEMKRVNVQGVDRGLRFHVKRLWGRTRL